MKAAIVKIYSNNNEPKELILSEDGMPQSYGYISVEQKIEKIIKNGFRFISVDGETEIYIPYHQIYRFEIKECPTTPAI
jgi:hypothetical protein